MLLKQARRPVIAKAILDDKLWEIIEPLIQFLHKPFFEADRPKPHRSLQEGLEASSGNILVGWPLTEDLMVLNTALEALNKRVNRHECLSA